MYRRPTRSLTAAPSVRDVPNPYRVPARPGRSRRLMCGELFAKLLGWIPITRPPAAIFHPGRERGRTRTSTRAHPSTARTDIASRKVTERSETPATVVQDDRDPEDSASGLRAG